MAETKTTTPQTRNQTPLYIVCIALLVAVVLAIVGFVGKNTANQQNAELTAQLEELTATKADLEEQVTAMTAGLEGKDEEITKLNTLLENLEAVRADLENQLSSAVTLSTDTQAQLTEEQDREVFFSKIFRIYASVLFCCVAGVIWLCRPMMHLFKAEYYDGWIFVPFLTLCSMCTCLNQFLNSIYVVYKRSTGSLVTMLCGAVLNLILNYCFILAWGPWGVTPASFLGLLLVFLLRAYSTRGLLEVDFHPGWLLLNLVLVLAEIFCIMRLENWVIPVTVLTAIVCAINFREIFSMLNKLVGKFLHRKKE